MSYLLGLSGSLRSGGTNTKLVHAAAASFGGDFQMGNLRLPLYDGDLEEESGIPESVQTLADQIAGAKAVVISTPEYNKSISGVLKNALDWVSRAEGSPWHGKPVAIMSAPAGRAGGERAGGYTPRRAAPRRAACVSHWLCSFFILFTAAAFFSFPHEKIDTHYNLYG